MFNLSSAENTPENQVTKELLRVELERLDSEISQLDKLLAEDLRAVLDSCAVTPRNREKQIDSKQLLSIKSPKPPLSNRFRNVSNSNPNHGLLSTDEFSPELITDRYRDPHLFKCQQQRQSVNATSRSRRALPSWSSHKDSSVEMNSSSDSIPDESEVNTDHIESEYDVSVNSSICNIPRAFPKKKKVNKKAKKRYKNRDKDYAEDRHRGRFQYMMPIYNPPVCMQYPTYVYNPYPYYPPQPMYHYPHMNHSHHISNPVFSDNIQRSASVSKEVSTQFSSSLSPKDKANESITRKVEVQHTETQMEFTRPSTVDIESVSYKPRPDPKIETPIKSPIENLIVSPIKSPIENPIVSPIESPIKSPKESKPDADYKIIVKQPWSMNFSESEQSLSDFFLQKKRNMLDKLQDLKTKPKKEHKDKTPQELMTIRKQMLKSASLKELPTRSASSEPTPAKIRMRDPSPELLARLCAGEKPKVTPQEMKRLTQKHYSALPEVQKKKTEADKKQELKERRAKAKEFDNKLRGKILT